MGESGALPSELTFPHLGRLTSLAPAGDGAAAWVLRSGRVGVKLARGADAPALEGARREAIVRALLGVGAPLDGGSVRLGRGRHPALAFRWVVGTRLSSLVGREHAAGWLEAVARDVGEALARLHLAGFRHGDVKPDNVIVRRTQAGPRAALVDLSLAAPFGAPLVGGSPEWLAPEALADPEHVGAAADVFALGRTLRRTAERLGVDPPAIARIAEAAHPGDRPSAARLAGWPERRVPIDAAYLRVRMDELERAAGDGLGPPAGPAGAWCEGLMRALAGLAGKVLGDRPLPPLDASGRHRLLAFAIGADAAGWSLPARLDDEASLLEALCAARAAGESSRSALIGTGESSGSARSVAVLLAETSLRPDDDVALARLAEASLGGALDDPTAHAAASLLRRAGRIAEARAIAEPRSTTTAAWRLEAAELARLAGDRDGAAARLVGAPPSTRAKALEARLALDVSDLAAARGHLAAAPAADATIAEGLALLAHAEGRFDDGLAALDGARLEDPERRARALSIRGMLLHGRGDPAGASRAFGRSADLALALAAVPLEATARASAAAAAHDAGKLGDALESADRAIDLLERLGRRADAARARLNRAAVLIGVGARAEAVAEARRAREASLAAGDGRAADYARWIEVDATTLPPAIPLDPNAPAALRGAIERACTPGDRLQAMAYARLAGVALDAGSRAAGDRLALDVEPAAARWTWWRAAIAADDPSAIDAVLRASDRDAPPSTIGPTLAAALDAARRHGRGDAARALVERIAHLVERLAPEIPLAHRPTFEALAWVRAVQSDTPRADALGLGAGQIELLGAITRGLRERGSLGELLRQVVDGLVLWVGVERGLLLLRAPGVDGGPPRLVPRVARGLSREDLRGEQLALSTSLADRALETLEPVVAVDAAAEHDLSASIHALRLRSVLAVPLVARGEALGVVYLDDRVRRGAFGPREVAWVRLLATHAASAIADARDTLRLRRFARRAERAQQRLEAHLAHTEGALEVARAQLATSARVAPGQDPRGTRHRYDALIGDGPAMRRLLSVLDRVVDAADARVPLLVVGESGTGKELVAHAIHDNGPRGGRPFVAENCGAIPEPLLESTLFGHVRGAFTGADRARVGLFEIAHGGTLFLDEVGEMGAAMQAKLLRVLQDGDVRPVGGEKSARVDVRVIAATHRDLEAMVRAGRFREDLYYRLAVIRVQVPALRERSEDVPALVEHFVGKFAPQHDVRVTRRALAAMAAAPWPGNVRQLENEIRRALVLCDVEPGAPGGGSRMTLDVEHLSPEIGALGGAAGPDGELSLRDQVDALERRLVGEAVRRADGNQTRAAKALGMSRFGLQKMLKRLGIAPSRPS